MNDMSKKSRKRFPVGLNIKTGHIDMSHGSGGRASSQLIEELFVKHLDNELLRQGNDNALFNVPAGRMVMSTDSHVISPLFFPGGDIGSLAVHGTVNDIAMSGARPLYLSAGFILEEGFPLADLDRIVASMAAAANEAGFPSLRVIPRSLKKAKAMAYSSTPPVWVSCQRASTLPGTKPARVMPC